MSLFPDIPLVEDDKPEVDLEAGIEAAMDEGDGGAPIIEPEQPCTCISSDGDIALVRGGKGLYVNVKPGAVCQFASGAKGVLLAWKEAVAILAIKSGAPAEGEEVRVTTDLMITRCSSAICTGRIVNAWGEPVDDRPAPPVPVVERQAFAEFKGMDDRTNQYQSLFTGVLGIDFSVPVGRGQTMLMQGTDEKKDKEHLWPDLMAVDKGPNAAAGPPASICVCRTREDAEQLRTKLEARGCWQRSVIVLAETPGVGATTLAMNGALSLAEQIVVENGEAMVLMDMEPMHRIWNAVAEAAGVERRAKGIMVRPEDEWTELEGTVLKESIAERRKFWFALISRAANAKGAGSATILAWVWEQAGGLVHRQQKKYRMKIDEIKALPRISNMTRERMIWKIEKQATDAGCPLDEEVAEPESEVPGCPNWEIEELKSITDGHLLLKPPSVEDGWGWHVDAYRSIARIGTDALHPALISVEAHKLRLKMLQGRDRANFLGDTRGAFGTLDNNKDTLELRFIELIMEQPAGQPMTIDEAIMRLMLVASPDCKPLRAPGGCTTETLGNLSAQLLKCTAGEAANKEVAAKYAVTEETQQLLKAEIDGLTA